MTPIDKTLLGKPGNCAQGSLILRRIGHDLSPRIILDLAQDDGDLAKMHLPLTAAETPIFVIQPVVINDGLWFASRTWDVFIEESTAYSALNEMPQAGDAFISDGIPGIIAILHGATAYVSLNGGLLPQPNWADDFVGFRKWEVRHWPTTDEKDAPEVVAAWERTG